MAPPSGRVNTHVYGAAMSNRLTKAEWLAHGLQALATGGHRALSVASMAASLKVSRGSFYWHFKDVADFRAQLLQNWAERTTEQVIFHLESDRTGRSKLQVLLRGAFAVRSGHDTSSNPWAAELAIRAWASEDATIAAAVRAVDDRRVSYMAARMGESGVPESLAQSRARFLYWAYLGRVLVAETDLSVLAEEAIDDIAMLFGRT